MHDYTLKSSLWTDAQLAARQGRKLGGEIRKCRWKLSGKHAWDNIVREESPEIIVREQNIYGNYRLPMQD